ncbi:MAG TPA: hypothetical protein VGD91_31805 [Trebonia sp.]
MSLDDDIAAWAATVRLSDREAAVMLQRITAPPTPAAAPAAAPRLDPSWWRGFNASFAARMVASTRPARLAAA